MFEYLFNARKKISWQAQVSGTPPTRAWLFGKTHKRNDGSYPQRNNAGEMCMLLLFLLFLNFSLLIISLQLTWCLASLI
jgi:hypothetical protein